MGCFSENITEVMYRGGFKFPNPDGKELFAHTFVVV